MTEAQIQSGILIAVTQVPGVMAWRSNSGLFRTLDGRRLVRANVPGCPDIIGVCKGRGIALETKRAKGDQRKTQELFQAAWEAAGGLYVVVHSVDEALAALS